ncbi:MAG: hypothetical protein ACK56F_11480, partial [bacterium]
PQTKASRDSHSPPPLLSMVSSISPFGDNTDGQTEVKIKQVITSLHEMTRLWRKLHQKFSCFSLRKGAYCAGLPARLPIKENPGEPGLQSAASDRHHHTPRGHNLNYTIWILYAESESAQQCHSFLGAP